MPVSRRHLLQGIVAGSALLAHEVSAGETLGRRERWAPIESRHIGRRDIEVWLPPNYDAGQQHSVLYFHDGQMAFDPSTTWNGQAWQIDQTLGPLIADGSLQSTLIVAVWNGGKRRHAEFFPQGFLPYLEPPEWRDAFVNQALGGQPRSDDYLKFIVEELKPAIDARYATRADREHTFLMGSSMGGLISLYGLCEYPQVFGGAAALSTHWIGIFERNSQIPSAALAYLERKLPPAGSFRLYLDRGTEQLDGLYDEAQRGVDQLLSRLGHTPPTTISRVFDGAGHTERDWQHRLAIPLRHLLGRAG